MRIVFMGTPEFAQASLQKLIETGHNIVGVFTQPDKPKGRGYKLVAPPVKELALEHNIPVYQPEKMKDGTALSTQAQAFFDFATSTAASDLIANAGAVPVAE